MTNASMIMENFREPHKRVKFLDKYYSSTSFWTVLYWCLLEITSMFILSVTLIAITE